MRVFKNNLFLIFSIIAVIIFFLFFLQFYYISSSYERDTNSYVTLIKGDGTLCIRGDCLGNKKVLKLNNREKLSNGDVIHILKDSFAIIEWGDKSVTRLGENTKFKVKNSFISKDLSKINISSELLKGKIRSNVISTMIGDSDFTLEIKGNTASVRGTVFEANYDHDYLVVYKHEVSVANKAGESKKVFQGQALSLKKFSLDNAILEIDKAFVTLNKKLDKDYLNKLRKDFLAYIRGGNSFNFLERFYNDELNVYNLLVSLKDKKAINNYISSLSEEDKKEFLKTLFTLSQVLNFENGENSDLYNIKLNIRSALLYNSGDIEYKEALVKYSVYDLLDILSLEKFSDEIVKNTYSLLLDNKQYFDRIKKSVDGGKFINELLNMDLPNLTPENLRSKLFELDSKGKDFINDSLNRLLELYKR